MKHLLPPELGRRLIEDPALRAEAFWGAAIGLLVGVIAFGLPLRAMFGDGGDDVVGVVTIVLILASLLVGAYIGPPLGDARMRRRDRKNAIRELGPGDVLIWVANAQSEAPRVETPIGTFDQRVAGMFRIMLMDRYRGHRSADVPRIGATLQEVVAQGDPSEEESTLATIVMAAVEHAALELREPRLAAQIAMEGVMAAMRFPKYAGKRPGQAFGFTDTP